MIAGQNFKNRQYCLVHFLWKLFIIMKQSSWEDQPFLKFLNLSYASRVSGALFLCHNIKNYAGESLIKNLALEITKKYFFYHFNSS